MFNRLLLQCHPCAICTPAKSNTAKGRAMAQAVSVRPLTAEARVSRPSHSI
jgi:hypothetical protein